MTVGIVADWDELVRALARSFDGLILGRTEYSVSSSSSRRWNLCVGELDFELVIDVFHPGYGIGAWHAANFGGVDSEHPIGDSLIEVGLEGATRGMVPPRLLWKFQNVNLLLSGEAGELVPNVGWTLDPAIPRRLRALAEAIQAFAAEHVVPDFEARIPNATLVAPLPAALALGSKLEFVVRTENIRDEDVRLECDDLESVGLRAPHLHVVTIRPPRVGRCHIGGYVQDRRTLLNSDRFGGEILVRQSPGREPTPTAAFVLRDCAIAALESLAIVATPPERDATSVFVVPLHDAAVMLFECATPVSSSAPPDVVSKLRRAVCVESRLRWHECEIASFSLVVQPGNFEHGRGYVSPVGLVGSFVHGSEDWLIRECSLDHVRARTALRGAGVDFAA